MRRVTAALTAAVLACLGLAACGEDDDRPSAEGGTGETWQDPVPAGESVEIEGWQITVEETEIDHGEEGDGEGTTEEPGEGYAHVRARVTADPTDGASSTYPTSDVEFHVLGADGFASQTEAACTVDDSLRDAAFEAEADSDHEGPLEGWICRDVPAELAEGGQWLVSTAPDPDADDDEEADPPQYRFASFDDRLPTTEELPEPDAVTDADGSVLDPVPVGEPIELNGVTYSVAESSTRPALDAVDVEASTTFTVTNTGEEIVDLDALPHIRLAEPSGRPVTDRCEGLGDDAYAAFGNPTGVLMPGSSAPVEICNEIPADLAPAASWRVDNRTTDALPTEVRHLELVDPDAPPAEPALTDGHLVATPAAAGDEVHLSPDATVSLSATTVGDPDPAAAGDGPSFVDVGTVLTVTNTTDSSRSLIELLDGVEFVGSDGAVRWAERTEVDDDSGERIDPGQNLPPGGDLDVRVTASVPAGATDGLWQVQPGRDADTPSYDPRYVSVDEAGTGLDLAEPPAGDADLGLTADDPAPVDARLEAEPWAVSLGATDTDARALVEAEGALDDVPADAAVVVVPVTSGHRPPSPDADPWTYSHLPEVALIDGNGESHAAYDTCRLEDRLWEVLPGGETTYRVCVTLPPEDLEGAVWEITVGSVDGGEDEIRYVEVG
ncbi:hypothetical protein ACPYO6_07855 [Georgenia sp. Z1344]|uniref:hypothetical protein n=1 Tax=Georgenia sp. Z1344 TaxID=3416706 RepID=UPI003CF9DA05